MLLQNRSTKQNTHIYPERLLILRNSITHLFLCHYPTVSGLDCPRHAEQVMPSAKCGLAHQQPDLACLVLAIEGVMWWAPVVISIRAFSMFSSTIISSTTLFCNKAPMRILFCITSIVHRQTGVLKNANQACGTPNVLLISLQMASCILAKVQCAIDI